MKNNIYNIYMGKTAKNKRGNKRTSMCGGKTRSRSKTKSRSKTPSNMTVEQSKVWYLAQAFKKKLSPTQLKQFIRFVNTRK